jgi:hypothetical protein
MLLVQNAIRQCITFLLGFLDMRLVSQLPRKCPDRNIGVVFKDMPRCHALLEPNTLHSKSARPSVNVDLERTSRVSVQLHTHCCIDVLQGSSPRPLREPN